MFIQSTVTICRDHGSNLCLPPVVGRSFASHIASMLRNDFPSAHVEIVETEHSDFSALQGALDVSDTVSEAVRAISGLYRSGEMLMRTLGIA